MGADMNESCRTVSDGGLVPADDESGHTVHVIDDQFDAKIADFDKTTTEAIGIQEGRDIQCGEEGRSGGANHSKERAVPPLLRLDTLARGRSSQEWSSPSSSRQATVTLSAASTRIPAHLVRAAPSSYQQLYFTRQFSAVVVGHMKLRDRS